MPIQSDVSYVLQRRQVEGSAVRDFYSVCNKETAGRASQLVTQRQSRTQNREVCMCVQVQMYWGQLYTRKSGSDYLSLQPDLSMHWVVCLSTDCGVQVSIQMSASHTEMKLKSPGRTGWKIGKGQRSAWLGEKG